MADTTRLMLFTVIWTAVWIAPLPQIGRGAELIAGLVPFAAFGLRVFAGFFVGVPEDDRVRSLVRPLLDWVDGRAGFPPYAWVLDATVALGLVWFASAFEIPRRARIATAWILPVVAAFAWASVGMSGMPIERLLAKTMPAVVLACGVGGSLGAVIRWTPSPIPDELRRRAAIVAILTVPAWVAAGIGALRFTSGLPSEHASQAESIMALVAGAGAAITGWRLGGFVRTRSQFAFAMALGVAAGAVVSLYA